MSRSLGGRCLGDPTAIANFLETGPGWRPGDDPTNFPPQQRVRDIPPDNQPVRRRQKNDSRTGATSRNGAAAATPVVVDGFRPIGRLPRV